MFKTPVKENQQQMNDKASILSNSGNLPEKQFEVTNSENKPLPSTSEILGWCISLFHCYILNGDLKMAFFFMDNIVFLCTIACPGEMPFL